MGNRIDILKPTSLLIIGDSVLRDLYCGLVYASLGGTGEDGKGGGSGKMCQWPKDQKDVVFYHTSYVAHVFPIPLFCQRNIIPTISDMTFYC
jgi:hypothetical protein